ncbi:MAG: LysM peptidoglycan-binding domain-containing protein [Anaerolineaceae bacterium]|nr:MAG: LysM peptidoglycan-binding domain-containing protein [Anaerolineaceae bacterium]
MKLFLRTLMLLLILIPASMTYGQDSDDSLTHVVQPGDTLFRIAVRYGVPMEQIAQANNIANLSRIYRGQVLVIPGLSVPDGSPQVDNPLVAGSPAVHVVQRGESLSMIARRYGMTTGQILQANNIANANLIYPGQSLNIWTEQSADAPLRDEPPAEQMPPVQHDPSQVNTTYTIQRGETLAVIANRFGVDWRVVAQMNGIYNPDNVQAGQQIVIPALNESGGAVDMGIVTQPFYVPTPTITQGRQIIISVSASRIYAFEDGQLVHSVLVSTGRAHTPTITGDFAIYRRVRTQTMSGPGYSIPNVEWVLYYHQAYAIHGAYWHSNWGTPMSAGCVNLPNEEARWFWENFGEIGTPVRVIA